jgi:hypothetical protein
MKGFTWREAALLVIVLAMGAALGWTKYENARLLDQQRRIENGTKYLMAKLEEVLDLGSGGIMPVYADETKKSTTPP